VEAEKLLGPKGSRRFESSRFRQEKRLNYLLKFVRIKTEKIIWKPMKEDKETTRLYQLHHIHHFNKNNRIVHEVHHCYAFAGKDMLGQKYEIYHVLDKNRLWHCLKLDLGRTAPVIIYDHAKRAYKIRPIKIHGKTHHRII